MRCRMEIVEISRQNLSDINKANQPFAVIGKLKPTFQDGIMKIFSGWRKENV